jgi:hypothetical protein
LTTTKNLSVRFVLTWSLMLFKFVAVVRCTAVHASPSVQLAPCVANLWEQKTSSRTFDASASQLQPLDSAPTLQMDAPSKGIERPSLLMKLFVTLSHPAF